MMPPADEDANLRAVRAMFDEFARRESAETFRILDEEVTLDTRAFEVLDLARVHHGHEGVRAFWRGWLAAWDRIEILDGPRYRAQGSQVAIWWRQRNVGRGSGLAVEQDAAWLWTFENGRIVRGAYFPTGADALRAAGMEPGD